jgi:predicted nucleic-acid-binding protein
MGSRASLVIAVDTNILVRYAIKDDSSQTEAATRFLLHNQCLLLSTVALETVWVLSSKKAYALPREVVVERMRHIAGLPTITVLEAKALDLALRWYGAGMDFADALHFAISNPYAGLATLDKKMYLCAKCLGLAERLVLLPIAEQ